MKLEIGNFHVKKIGFGDRNLYENGVLTINKQQAEQFLMQSDKHITSAEIKIARPGEKIRIVPVKEAVEPRFRPDGRAIFPAISGKLVPSGEGTVYALKNVAVLGVGKHWGSFGDGLIDMSGEGTQYSYFSGLNNICLVIDTDEESERYEQQKKNTAIRMAVHRFAQYLGQVLEGQTPESWEKYEQHAVAGNRKNTALPSVVLVMQCQSQMEEAGYNDLFYGWDMNKYLPTFVNATEILDGAVISGSFMPCSSKWSTYDFQNFPTIKELFQEDGKTINFLGVILSNLNVSLEQKERSAIVLSNMAKALGADGAIVTEEGYGNPDADYIGAIVALEDVGVKVVGISNECNGRDGRSQPLVTYDIKVNALISTGNVSQIIDLPPMETVIGELESLARDGLSGGWSGDEILGSSVREDGSIIMENNSMFCGDQIAGWSKKVIQEI